MKWLKKWGRGSLYLSCNCSYKLYSCVKLLLAKLKNLHTSVCLNLNYAQRNPYIYEKVHPWNQSWSTRVVIDNMFVYHFAYPDLRVDIFFKKDGAVEYGGVDFKIGNIGTLHLSYWELKKISCRACLFFLCVWQKI